MKKFFLFCSLFCISITQSSHACIIVSAYRDGTIKLWNTQLKRCIKKAKGDICLEKNIVSIFAASKNGKYIALGSRKGDVEVWQMWDIKNNKKELVCKKIKMFRAHGGYIISLSFNNDGTRLITSSEDDTCGNGTIKIWGIGNKITKIYEWNCDFAYPAGRYTDNKHFKRYKNHNNDISVSKKSLAIFAKSVSDLIKKPLKSCNFHSYDIALSFDSSYFATSAHSYNFYFADKTSDKQDYDTRDNAIKLWRLKQKKYPFYNTGQTYIKTLHGHKDYVSALSFGKDSKLLLSSAYDDTIKVWDLAEEKELVSLQDNDAAKGIAFVLYNVKPYKKLKLYQENNTLIDTIIKTN